MRRTQKGCAQHKRAREHRARGRGGLGCGRVRTYYENMIVIVVVEHGEDGGDGAPIEDDLGARLLDQELLGYVEVRADSLLRGCFYCNPAVVRHVYRVCSYSSKYAL